MSLSAASHLTLIDELLAEQQQLTAVERFSRQHIAGALPAQERYYRSLLPLTPPEAGEQYAFAVDLDRCTSCKGCVSACHSLNGLEEDEIWRNVGILHGGTTEAPYQQTVTTACHHCVEPACLEGCPVMAYEKDAATGIVRHLDDQCIGCQYCVLKCPYDVPKYSARRGIVRKCDLCYHRLAANEAPACVQACPNEAISIRVVAQETVRATTAPGDVLVPGAFASTYTLPTTAYTTRKPVPANAQPADAATLRLAHAHGPLVAMLVLTQWAAGLLTAAAALAWLAPEAFAQTGRRATGLGFALLQAGLAVSVLHLGRPLGAWRFFLGLRTSWMSREILAFGLFAGAAAAFAAATWGPAWLPVRALGAAAAGSGLLGVGCSAMIYIDTRRPFWAAGLTVPKFLGTVAVLGFGTLGAVLHAAGRSGGGWLAVASVALAASFGWEAVSRRRAAREAGAPWHRPARLHAVGLPGILRARWAVLALALAAAPFFPAVFVVLAATAFALERYCYFAACEAPRMPGGIGG